MNTEKSPKGKCGYIIHHCEKNNNIIGIVESNGQIDHLSFTTSLDGSNPEIIIHYADLLKALEIANKKISEAKSSAE